MWKCANPSFAEAFDGSSSVTDVFGNRDNDKADAEETCICKECVFSVWLLVVCRDLGILEGVANLKGVEASTR